ncbi:MAG: ABC transporter ATP-binding protein/permease [Cellulomonadaceae bacterium]
MTPSRAAVARPVLLSWLGALALAAVYLAVGAAVDALDASSGLSAVTTAVLLTAPVVVGVAAWAGLRGTSTAQASTEARLRRGLVAHVFALGSAERGRAWTGRTVGTATDGVERSAAYSATFIGPMIGSMTIPVLTLVVLAVTVDGPTAGFLAIALPVIPLFIGGFQKAFRKVSRRSREAARRLSAQFLDALQGLGTLRALHAGGVVGARLAQAAEEQRRRTMQLLAGNQLVLLVTDAVFSLAMITTATGLAIVRLRDGAITPGQAVAVVLLATLLLEPLDRIGQFFYIGMGGIAATKEIRGFLAQRPPFAPGDVDPGESARTVDLDDVDFAYDDAAPVLHGAGLHVADGEDVALVGRSGAGKTTTLELVQGSLQPQSGTVRLGGHDLARTTPHWTRRQSAVVAQSTYLFTGSLAANLRIADPVASDDRLWQALEDAHLAEEVRTWPDGLGTLVGERGLALSGGQAQRVAIARALLKDAPIVLLDEPTSQVDLTSERAILAALERLTRGRTVLTVAHRASTISGADRVVRVADGVFVEVQS